VVPSGVARHGFRADGAAGAAFVLDNDIGAEQWSELMAQQAR
jgi:hypothetical protein